MFVIETNGIRNCYIRLYFNILTVLFMPNYKVHKLTFSNVGFIFRTINYCKFLVCIYFQS